MSKICIYCHAMIKSNQESCGACGRTEPSRHSHLLDSRYEVLSEIKSGAMGCVYKAMDTRLDNIVALKKMISSLTDPEEIRFAEQSFRQEAKLLSRLHHGGLPKVTDYFTSRDEKTGLNCYYLAMTFIEGKDLETVIAERKKRPFPIEAALDYFYQILEILRYLHSQPEPVIYRDLKPSNIIISDEKIFLVDFGLASIASAQEEGIVSGTAGYISPEQLKGFADPRSDLYSLGVLMHFLLTGMDPQESQSFTFDSPRKLNRNIPEGLDSIIMSLVNPIPDCRPQSAELVIQLIEHSTEKADSKSSSVEEVLDSHQKKTSRDYTDIFEAIRKSDMEAVREFIYMGTDVNARDRDGWATLHRIIESCNKELTDVLISRGADINAKTNFGWTPLHLAVIYDQDDISESLLIEGADIDAQDDDGWTPLHWAANQGNRELVDFLIRWRAKINLTDRDGWAPLHWAVFRSNTEMAASLISAKARTDLTFPDGSSFLHKAVSGGSRGMTELLLSSGADINARNVRNYNRTPFHGADRNDRDFLAFLISKGADIFIEDRLGVRPLDSLSGKEMTDFFSYYGLPFDDSDSLRYSSAGDEDPDSLRWLGFLDRQVRELWQLIAGFPQAAFRGIVKETVEVKPDDDMRDFGYQLIQLDCGKMQPPHCRVRLFQSAKAYMSKNPSMEAEIGSDGSISAFTPCPSDREWALRFNVAVLKIYLQVLTSRGGNNIPDGKDREGEAGSRAELPAGSAGKAETASQDAISDICSAAGRGDIARLQACIDRSPHMINLTTDVGTTPLHWASSGGSLRAAGLLISSGARIDIRDSMGLTPLHLARTKDIAALLIDHGAEVDARSYYGRTPLHCATGSGNREVVEFLISRGADVNARNKKGETALKAARKFGKSELVSILLQNGAGE